MLNCFLLPRIRLFLEDQNQSLKPNQIQIRTQIARFPLSSIHSTKTKHSKPSTQTKSDSDLNLSFSTNTEIQKSSYQEFSYLLPLHQKTKIKPKPFFSRRPKNTKSTNSSPNFHYWCSLSTIFTSLSFLKINNKKTIQSNRTKSLVSSPLFKKHSIEIQNPFYWLHPWNIQILLQKPSKSKVKKKKKKLTSFRAFL